MWVKIDDRMHNHRKTRHVLRGDDSKSRDAAPMGLWMLAASWAGQNSPAGWVPADELDRWDDDWEPLAARLVKAGYWWPEERDGEPGFGLVNWQEYNPSTGASDSGAYGNHQRWHVNRGVVSPDCQLCPQEPVPDEVGSSGGIAPRFLAEIAPESEIIALPDPTRPEPESNTSCASADAADARDDRFAEFWDAYDKKRDRKKAEQKWRLAIKKRGVTPDLLIDAATKYIAFQRAEGKHPKFTKDPTTWLNGESWTNTYDRPADDPDDDWAPPPIMPRDLYGGTDEDYRIYLESMRR